MFHTPLFPQSASPSTIAAYFLYGLEAGLFPEDCAREWAFRMIESIDTPPVTIIEVASARQRETIFSTLGTLASDGDKPLAGRWLLDFVHSELKAGRLPARSALRKAMQIASSTSLPDTVYYDFDSLEDQLWLAENGTCGSVDKTVQYALEALASHGRNPASAT
jgi:hypothetical protein